MRQATGRCDVGDLHDGVVYLFCQEAFREALGKVWLHRVLHSAQAHSTPPFAMLSLRSIVAVVVTAI